jgi:DNA modification methylase
MGLELSKERGRVILGDCREIMRALPSNSVDSVVTDPP